MNTKLLILFAFIVSFIACENQDIEFEDFGTTAVYFPFQTPARSLILGKYDLGFNDNDNNHFFEIGVTMAGVYDNDIDRKVHFQLASELLTDVKNVSVLPTSHYSIETSSPVTIPQGSLKGRIKVQLTDAFFTDPLSFAPKDSVNYVIPLLITQIEQLDTVLSGLPIVSNPSRVNAADWKITPKDYTLYGIKFMNKYHGDYLRRGVDEKVNLANETGSRVYHNKYVEGDELVTLTTTGKDNVELSNIMVRRAGAESTPKFNFELVFTDDENFTIRSFGDQDNISGVTGSGKFVENGDTWGGKERDVFYLEYTYTDDYTWDDKENDIKDIPETETHTVKDTLVVRNRNVVFEEFPILLN